MERGRAEVLVSDPKAIHPKLKAKAAGKKSQYITFMFLGSVTLTPSKGALPLCKALGQQLYI